VRYPSVLRNNISDISQELHWVLRNSLLLSTLDKKNGRNIPQDSRKKGEINSSIAWVGGNLYAEAIIVSEMSA